jgi:hypothetical protein
LLIDGLMYLSRNWLAGVLYAQIQWPFIFDPALRQVASLHRKIESTSVCRNVKQNVYTYTHIHIHTYINTYIHMYIHTHIHIYTCTYTHIYI